MNNYINKAKLFIYESSRFLFFFKYGKSKHAIVYLTFDDGPIGGTVKCFQLCHKYDIKASFFFIGTHWEKLTAESSHNYENLSDKFLICNHSYSHGNNNYKEFYKNPEFVCNDFLKAEKILNVKSKIARLPGSNTWSINSHRRISNSKMLISSLLSKFGYKIFGWDLDYNSYSGGKAYIPLRPTQLVNKLCFLLLMNKTFKRNHLVILLHDNLFVFDKNIIHLELFIKELKNLKYIKFDTLNNYPD